MKPLLLTLMLLVPALAQAQDVSVTVTVPAADVAAVEAATIDKSNPERVANGDSAETLQQYMQRVLDAAVANWKAQAIADEAEAIRETYESNEARRAAIKAASEGR